MQPEPKALPGGPAKGLSNLGGCVSITTQVTLNAQTIAANLDLDMRLLRFVWLSCTYMTIRQFIRWRFPGRHACGTTATQSRAVRRASLIAAVEVSQHQKYECRCRQAHRESRNNRNQIVRKNVAPQANGSEGPKMERNVKRRFVLFVPDFAGLVVHALDHIIEEGGRASRKAGPGIVNRTYSAQRTVSQSTTTAAATRQRAPLCRSSATATADPLFNISASPDRFHGHGVRRAEHERRLY